MNTKPQLETTHRGRRRFAKFAVIGCALAVALAGVALAALPKPGTVLTGTAKSGSGAGSAYDLTFKVKSKHMVQKVIAIRQGAKAVSKGGCLPPDNFSFKRVHVESDGSFKDHAVGYMYKATMTGKFKSPTKAKGTIHACSPALDFTVTK